VDIFFHLRHQSRTNLANILQSISCLSVTSHQIDTSSDANAMRIFVAFRFTLCSQLIRSRAQNCIASHRCWPLSTFTHSSCCRSRFSSSDRKREPFWPTQRLTRPYRFSVTTWTRVSTRLSSRRTQTPSPLRRQRRTFTQPLRLAHSTL
jgi:hypothetical protein